MCTTATLEVARRRSPLFDMHTEYPGWSEKLAPGKKAKLRISFDPAFHGEKGLGKVVRAVYIFSDDSGFPERIVMIWANVVE